jgi:hypothetical protein
VTGAGCFLFAGIVDAESAQVARLPRTTISPPQLHVVVSTTSTGSHYSVEASIARQNVGTVLLLVVNWAVN